MGRVEKTPPVHTSEQNLAGFISRVPSELATQRTRIESAHTSDEFVPNEHEIEFQKIIESPDISVFVAATDSYRMKENQVVDFLAQKNDLLEQQEASGSRIVVSNNVVMQAGDGQATRDLDQFGRVIIQLESELRSVVKKLHRHEGVAKLQHLFSRNFVFVPKKPGRKVAVYKKMREVVSEVVRNCQPCIIAKDKRNVAPLKSSGKQLTQDEELNPNQNGSECDVDLNEVSDGIPRGSHPHELVCMDTWVVAGDLPSSELDAFAVTLIDAYSGFLKCKFLPRKPGSTDAAELLRDWRKMFCIAPEKVITDQGTEFLGDFAMVCKELNIQHTLVPVNSSWQNGQVERVHNTFNNWLRAKLASEPAPSDVHGLIRWAEQCVELHNTTVSESTGVTPHSLMFTFKPWIYDELRGYRPKTAVHLFPKIIRKQKINELKKFREDEPKLNETWLVQVFKRQGKFSLNRFVKCEIVEKVGLKMFRIREKISKKLYDVHRKSLKLFSSPV